MTFLCTGIEKSENFLITLCSVPLLYLTLGSISKFLPVGRPLRRSAAVPFCRSAALPRHNEFVLITFWCMYTYTRSVLFFSYSIFFNSRLFIFSENNDFFIFIYEFLYVDKFNLLKFSQLD
jgi:hypothetical protein